MKAIIIISAIALFLVCLFGFLPIHLRLEYNGSFSLYLRVLFLKFALFPKKEKKARFSDYSAKRLKKKVKSLKKKKAKRENKPSVKDEKSDKLKKSLSQKAIGSAVFTVIREFYEILTRGGLQSPKIKIFKIHINVATGDAATTAVAYGGVCCALNGLLCYFNENAKLIIKNKNSLSVIPDYTADKFSSDIDIDFSLLSGRILKLAFAFAGAYIKKMINSNKQ